MKFSPATPLAIFALAVILLPLPSHAQSVPCAAITHNRKTLDVLLDLYPNLRNPDSSGTITINELPRFPFNPIVIQPGDALYIAYRGEPFNLTAHLANGNVIPFPSASKARPDQWRNGIFPLDMPERALNQKLVQLTATANNPEQVLLRNIRIIRAGKPSFEFAELSSYGRTQVKKAATRKLLCKGNDEYSDVATAYNEANRLAATINIALPPTLTAQEINAVALRNAPPIEAGDQLLMEANRSDFDLALLLSDGKVIITGPHASTTAAGWRPGRVKLDFPATMKQQIVGMQVRLLHTGGTPLLFRAIQFQRQGRVILTVDRPSPVEDQTAETIEPPMSYPPDPVIPNPHITNVSLPGPGGLIAHRDTGFLAPKVPTFPIIPMMFQSTTTTTGDPNHYKFNGKELDAETGLYNYGARYYNPALSRFMSPDWSGKPVPIPYANLLDPQTLNLYAYVRNNPVSLPDPDGHAIQLSDDADERKKQLAAAQQAVGKDAGKYLYDNTDKNGHHYIGIYSNGPDGQGPAFKDINGASNKLNNIIGDSRTVFVSTVSPGTNVLPNLSPSGLIGPTTSGLSPGGSRPINQVGGDEVLYLVSGDPGKLPTELSSTGHPATITPGDVFSHETGHIYSRWFGGDSNTSSVQMENQTRHLNGEPLRTGHSERGDVPQ